jgi:hypothetical protein
MPLDRRHFLTASTASLAGAAISATNLRAAPDAPKAKPADAVIASTTPAGNGKRPWPIGVSTYSFWRFRDDSKISVEDCIDQAAAMGFDAVEILHMQMEDDESAARLQNIKRRAFLAGLPLCGFSTHQTFLSPDEAVRKRTSSTRSTACNSPTRWAFPRCASTRAAGARAKTSTS